MQVRTSLNICKENRINIVSSVHDKHFFKMPTSISKYKKKQSLLQEARVWKAYIYIL